jgi:recombinational DNA repair protein RecT
MSKMKKIIILVFVCFIGGYFGYKYIMTVGERNLETEKSAFVVSWSTIYDEFAKNTELATSKYLNKAIEISGKVTASENSLVTLNGKISCLLETNEKVDLNTSIVIKGRVTGYDDLLEELKLDQCIIIKD